MWIHRNANCIGITAARSRIATNDYVTGALLREYIQLRTVSY
jgi:hypothetical protein